MAVIVQYVVERDGKQIMTFATKKEADAYDKQLDIAEHLRMFFGDCDVTLEEPQLENLTLFLAKNRDIVIQLLKGHSLAALQATAAEKSAQETHSVNVAAETKSAKSTKNAKTGKGADVGEQAEPKANSIDNPKQPAPGDNAPSTRTRRRRGAATR